MKLLVNLITLFRMFGSIILTILDKNISTKNFLTIMFLIFITDLLDGYLARKFHVQTFFGSLTDALADKILCICLLIPLTKKYKYIIILPIMESIILIINLIGKIKGKFLKSIKVGKVKMWSISITIIIGYILLLYNKSTELLYLFLVITSILQIITLIEYIKYLLRQSKEKSTKKEKLTYILFNTEYYLNETSKH